MKDGMCGCASQRAREKTIHGSEVRANDFRACALRLTGDV